MSFFNTTKKKTETPKETQKRIEELEKRMQALQGDLVEYKKAMKSAVTKVGIVRFNPFHEIGSDQSFSLALLDQEDNGFVLTSHYLKEYNRVYAKPVRKGASEYSLSEEEKEAIEQAVKSEARNPTQSSDGSPHRMIGAKSETNSNERNPKSKTT